MASTPQPAKKSYFFGKGYRDVGNTIKGAWKRNFDSISGFKEKIEDAKLIGGKKAVFLIILNVLAMLSVLVFGSIITAVVSLLNIAAGHDFYLYLFLHYLACRPDISDAEEDFYRLS